LKPIIPAFARSPAEGRDGARMDRKKIKETARKKIRPLVLALDRLGLTPTSVSVIGLLVTFVASWIIAKGGLFLGALVLLVGSLFDMLDGDLARLQGRVSRQGAFIDSNFDRLAESALFIGLAWYFMTALATPHSATVLLVMVALAGSLTTSYARARAEGLGSTCLGGWMQRPERMVLVVLGMLLGWRILELVVIVLAVATVITTVQRIVSTSRLLAEEDAAGGEGTS